MGEAINNDDALITDREVAERYSVRRETVWKWAKRGRIPAPHPRFPGRWLKSAIVNDIRTMQTEAQEEAVA